MKDHVLAILVLCLLVAITQAASAAPVVTGISPDHGPVTGGTVVTVTGTGFTGATDVSFGATPGTDLTVTNDTSISITSPAHSCMTVYVIVTTPEGSSGTPQVSRYSFDFPPGVTAASPATGPVTGGTVVTLTGTSFGWATAVRFGSTPGTGLTIHNDTSLSITSPAHTAGTVYITVTGPGGTSADTSGSRFTYEARPVVTAVSPDHGPFAGGTRVTLTGTGFTGATAVRFGATAGTSLTVNSSTKITVTTPAHSSGTVYVTVNTPGGTSATPQASRFLYTFPAAYVTAVSPAGGPEAGGTRVTLTGTGFTGATAVRFGNAAGTAMTVNSDTNITVTSPAHISGTVYVTVTTPDGTSLTVQSSRYRYLLPPRITAISPDHGPITGGTRVTLTGRGFTGATAVRFGTTAGTAMTVNNDTSLSITSPAHAAGRVDVRVTTPGGTSAIVIPDRFTYTA